MRSVVFTAAVVGLLSASSAFAADLPVRGRSFAEPAPAPAYYWTGWYVGAHIGAGQQTSDATVDIAPVPGFPLANTTGSGVLGGVQAGYNYQTGWAVWGIEAAFTGTDIRSQGPCFVGIANCTSDVNWMASISGRFGGLVTDRFLAYVKGGATWKDTDYSISVPTVGSATISDTRFGYLVGFGGEYKFTQNWSGFTEYNYQDYGREDYSSTVAAIPAVAHIKDTVHVLKAGINYKW